MSVRHGHDSPLTGVKPAGADAAAPDPRIERALRLACFAPSSHNSQPWLVAMRGDAVDVYADRRRALPVVDPHDRALTISCGALVGTFEVAARYLRVGTTVQWLPLPSEPDLLARIECGPGDEPDDDDILRFEAIRRRRTVRGPFDPQAPPDSLLQRCSELSARHGATFERVDDAARKRTVASLVAAADRRQFADLRFRRELSAWIHPRRSASHDGMSVSASHQPDYLSGLASRLIRTFDIGGGVAATDTRRITRESPVLALFATCLDDAFRWLDTGRALAHVLLELAAHGYSCSYLNQPIEVDSMRARVAEALGSSLTPQLLLRIGRACKETPASARRPFAEVRLPAGDGPAAG